MSTAKASSCYTPTFLVSLTPVSGFEFVGAVSGEIEGTVLIEFDPATSGANSKFAGKTIHNSGHAAWEITGGVLPAPLEFPTIFDNLNIIKGPGVFANNGKHRAESGVEKANLTYSGEFRVSPTPQGEQHFHGVICP